MTAKDTLTLTVFPVVVNSDCKNIKRIYPLKQKMVAEIYDALKERKEVKRVIIFGSSVTARCHINSDIDICIDADTDDGKKLHELNVLVGNICDWNCDIIIYGNIKNNLKETIDREGVVIYE